MRFGIALIVAGIAVIVFTALFGFPKAPPVPMAIEYADYSEPINFTGGEIQQVAIRCGTESNGVTTWTNTATASSGDTVVCGNYFEQSK